MINSIYAKDLKPGHLFVGESNGNKSGWQEVLEVNRERSLAKQAMLYRYVTDMQITILCRATGETYTEEVNSHAVYKDVVEG
jgi:hypothetical protein